MVRDDDRYTSCNKRRIEPLGGSAITPGDRAISGISQRPLDSHLVHSEGHVSLVSRDLVIEHIDQTLIRSTISIHVVHHLSAQRLGVYAVHAVVTCVVHVLHRASETHKLGSLLLQQHLGGGLCGQVDVVWHFKNTRLSTMLNPAPILDANQHRLIGEGCQHAFQGILLHVPCYILTPAPRNNAIDIRHEYHEVPTIVSLPAWCGLHPRPQVPVHGT
mmetsp:Transcript_44428/g.105251  ORF Transcript_44428/g.105251 Transcript_44428/m.105251 type:complete len:217 (+) Transcript_44428:578-1228(+)